MRDAFVETLAAIARADRRVVLLTGDLGYGVVDRFAREFPDRFFNVGVAEQQLVGLATGLAEAGYVPFVYSLASFGVCRPYEFIRNGPVQHGWPVRIIGIGGGFEYGRQGLSHYALEDLAVMRAQPGLAIVVPADAAQARTALLATWGEPGPVYYRISKLAGPPIAGLEGRFCVGRLQIVREGDGVAILAVGTAARDALAAADAFTTQTGRPITVAVVASVAPFPTAEVAAVAANSRILVTVESHYGPGGVGSAVAEVLAVRGHPCRLVRCAAHHVLDPRTADTRVLEARHGLDARGIATALLEAWAALEP